MPSPVPRHLRTDEEIELIEPRHRAHVVDLHPNSALGVKIPGSQRHRAKFAAGLPTLLLDLSRSGDIGDPMCGVGSLAWETGKGMKLNDIDSGLAESLDPLRERCEITFLPADKVAWRCEVCVFSPPYYPKTDRTRACAHNDEKRGPVVGFRDSYDCDHPDFIGNPGGVNAIRTYRDQMTSVYAHLLDVCDRMIVVTKNWTRLGVELRLDLDTILMCQEVGWDCVGRHGWCPPPSLWSRYNARRGGGVLIEDVLMFARREVVTTEEAVDAVA